MSVGTVVAPLFGGQWQQMRGSMTTVQEAASYHVKKKQQHQLTAEAGNLTDGGPAAAASLRHRVASSSGYESPATAWLARSVRAPQFVQNPPVFCGHAGDHHSKATNT